MITETQQKIVCSFMGTKSEKRSLAYLEHFCPTYGTNPCGCRPTIFHCDLFLVFH